MGLFNKEKTLDELEQENQRLEIEQDIAKKRANIAVLKRKLDAQGGTGFWKTFSSDGKSSGFSVGKAWNWLKSH